MWVGVGAAFWWIVALVGSCCHLVRVSTSVAPCVLGGGGLERLGWWWCGSGALLGSERSSVVSLCVGGVVVGFSVGSHLLRTVLVCVVGVGVGWGVSLVVF